MKLSHSKVQKYLECGQAYDYQYNYKLRSRVTSAALLFGSAVDNALNYVFRKLKNKETYTLDQAVDTFKHEWLRQKINKVDTLLMESPNVVYAKTDLDVDLLEEDDIVLLSNKAAELGLGDTPALELIKEIKAYKEQQEHRKFKDTEATYLNIANWLSMNRKGIMFIKAYSEQILPRIKQVIDFQRKVEIPSTEGNTIEGYIDLICQWEDDSIVIVDNKTSKLRYDNNEVGISEQLAIYKFALDNELKALYNVNEIKCGYIVLIKQLKKDTHKECKTCGYVTDTAHKTCNALIKGKRCNGEWDKKVNSSVDIQVLIDTINERTEEIVLNNFENATRLLNTNIYVRNTHACVRNSIICPYYSLCWKNEKKDLVEV